MEIISADPSLSARGISERMSEKMSEKTQVVDRTVERDIAKLKKKWEFCNLHEPFLCHPGGA